jgi:hypothetical protein
VADDGERGNYGEFLAAGVGNRGGFWELTDSAIGAVIMVAAVGLTEVVDETVVGGPPWCATFVAWRSGR